MLTPHIVRVLDLSEDDLRPLRLPREGTGASIVEPIIIPPQPFVPPAPPAQAPAQPAPAVPPFP
jgi:hypothetical protein